MAGKEGGKNYGQMKKYRKIKRTIKVSEMIKRRKERYSRPKNQRAKKVRNKQFL